MLRKYPIFTFIPIVTMVMVLMSPQVALPFWYGTKDSLYAKIGIEAKEAFSSCLTEQVFPYVDADIDSAVLAEDWYGNLNLMLEELSTEGKLALNQCLITHILPELDANLVFEDNRGGDQGVTIYNPAKADDGYTLLSSIRGHGCNKSSPVGAPWFPVTDGEGNPVATNTCGAVLIDMQGSIVNEWPLVAVPAKMLPDGHLLGLAITPLNGPPIGALQSMLELDWCGNETWRWPTDAWPVFPIFGGARVHHDFQREGNPVGYFAPGQLPALSTGNTLVLSNQYSPYPLPISPPLSTPEISQHELLEDVILEVDSNGAIVWTWRPYEHVDQMGFNPQAREATQDVRVAGIGGVGAGEGTTDWQHLNSASYLGPNKWYNPAEPGTWIFHPDNVIYDSRTSNYLAIIARVDHPRGKWKADDIVWRVGPNYSPGDREGMLGQIIGPHMAHMIPQGLPGEGNILLFDNGGVAGYGALLPGLPGTYPATFRDYSRVIEFNPKTLKIVWEYRCPQAKFTIGGKLERKFYSRLISGAQRLKNGNTLITEGASGRIFEVTRGGMIVWEYIHKNSYANGAFPLLGFLPPTAIYRAYRVPKSWGPVSPECSE